MKLRKLKILVPILALVITSCNSEKSTDMNDDGLTREEKKEDDGADAEFLRDAAEINLQTIHLSELATTSATMQETRDMAKMMMEDHKKVNAQVVALASKLGVSIPTYADNEGERKYESLSKKEGADFDKEYSDLMVKSHKDAVDRYVKAIDESENPDVLALANSTLPSLREHLTHAEHCQKMAKDAK